MSSAHLDLVSFSHFFLAVPLNLNQIGWGVSANCHLQVSPQMFCGVQSWALPRPLKDIKRLVPVMLKGETSSQSDVVCTLELDLTVFGSIYPFFFLTIPATEKHSQSMMLLPPCFTTGDNDNDNLLVTYTVEHNEFVFFTYPSLSGSWGYQYSVDE